MYTSGSSSSRSRPPLFTILPDWIGPSFFDPRCWIHLFVPAQYPTSVQQPGYTHYAIYTFVASIAGSASMVLSTQTLLMTMMMTTTTTDIGATTNVTSSSILTDDRENHEMEHCEVPHSLSSTENNMTTLADTAAAASSSNTNAAVAAGALNWVFKDGIGQLGGIVVASYMGNLRYLDSNPKRYRMYAALALDIAAWMELCTPYVSVMMTTMTAGSAVGTWTTAAVVVPMACIATVGKNIGFIMASASRATIHQALCTTHPTKPVTTTTTTLSSSSSQSTTQHHHHHHHHHQHHNNLADVTAKFGSQSTAAGLLGTILGIAISSSCSSGTAPMSILIPFFGLVMIHQGSNYMALRSVALYHLNRQRLGIVLHDYVQQQQQQQCFHVHYQKRPDHDSSTSGRYSANDRPARVMDRNVLTPAQVAEKEYFLPSLRFLSTFTASRSNADADDDGEDNNLDWLAIGCSLPLICPNGPDQLVKLLQACSNEEEYVLNVECTGDASGRRKIQLSFFEPANSHDVLRGMLHAYRFRYELVQQQQQQYQRQMRGTFATITTTLVHNDDESMMLQLIHHSHAWVQNNFPSFHDALQASGWNTHTTFVEEGRNTYRFAISFGKGTLN
jgi:Vitamin B6 photo-protection and homoeostasis